MTQMRFVAWFALFVAACLFLRPPHGIVVDGLSMLLFCMAAITAFSTDSGGQKR